MLPACGGDESSGPRVDAPVVDAGDGEIPDAVVDASIDAAAPAPLDGGADAAAPVDASSDSGADAGPVEPFVCNVTPPTSCPTPMPVYADVAPIIERRCAVCHGASWTGNWPLSEYRHVVDWTDGIRGHLINCTMPPRDSGYGIMEDERMTILNWIRCGTPCSATPGESCAKTPATP